MYQKNISLIVGHSWTSVANGESSIVLYMWCVA